MILAILITIWVLLMILIYNLWPFNFSNLKYQIEIMKFKSKPRYTPKPGCVCSKCGGVAVIKDSDYSTYLDLVGFSNTGNCEKLSKDRSKVELICQNCGHIISAYWKDEGKEGN